MTCRVAIAVPTRPEPPTARQRLEKIDRLTDGLLDAIERQASPEELSVRAMEIQGQACIGAAYERRRARGTSEESR